MLRPGHTILLCVLALLCVGVVMVTSAGLTVTGAPISVYSILVSRPALYATAALFAALCASTPRAQRSLSRLLSPTRTKPTVGWLFLCTLLLVFVCILPHLPPLQRHVNGSARWVEIRLPGLGSMSAQPSEIAKWSLPLLLAWHAASQGPLGVGALGKGLLPGLFAVGAVAAVVAKEDLGTGALLAAAGGLTLVAGGAKFRWMALALPLSLLAAWWYVQAEPYRMTRITSFLRPYDDPAGAGYHMIQSVVAVANGEIAGRGLGFGVQKFGYLPEDRTDFLFAIVCEELGVAGAAVVVGLYIALLWSGWSIACRQTCVARGVYVFGVLATLGLQATINLFVVTGLGPTKGIALPLLSHGGTGWLLTALSLGLVAGLDPSDEPEPALATRALGPIAAQGTAALPASVQPA